MPFISHLFSYNALVANRIVGDRFELKTRLDRDETLWRATDLDIQSDVLVRLLSLSKRDMRGWVRLESMLEEMSEINCKNIARILEWGDCAEGKYIALEWFESSPLTNIRLSLPDAVNFLLVTARALKNLTDCDIIHPSLTSDSIVISDDGPKLFGFDTLVTERTRLRQMKPNELTETLSWVAPELLSGKKPNVLSNLYSFGLICYFSLTRELPFKDTNPNSLVWSIKNSTPPPVSMFNPAVPVTLENMIKRLLHKDPSSRFQTFYEVTKSLEKSLSELGSSSSISINTGMMLHRGRIIGKLKELSSIEDEVRNPKGSVVFIKGENGVGKTRFLQDVMSSARNLDMVTLNTTCDHTQKEQPWSTLSMLVDEIIEEFGIGIIGRSRFKREFASICPKLQSRAMLMSESVYKDTSLLSSKLKLAFPWLLSKITEKRNGLLVVDDIHNCDNESLEVFRVSFEALNNAKLTFLFSLSAENEKYIIQKIHPNSTPKQISLNALSPKQTMEMVSSVLGNKDVPLHVVDMLHNKTKGNPLRILQIVAGLISGGISLTSGNEVGASDIPLDLTSIAKMRIRNLDKISQEIMAEAAIIGTTFREGFLIEVSSHPRTTVEEVLDRARMSMILSMIKTANGFRYSFIFDELKTCLLESLTLSQRRHFHDRAGRILKNKYKDNLDNHLEELINHLLHGGNRTLAIPHLLRLANLSLSNFQLSKAIKLCSIAKETAIKSGNTKHIISSTIQLADLKQIQGKTKEAKEILDGTYHAMSQAGIDLTSEVKLLISIARFESTMGNISLSEQNVRAAYNKMGKNLNDEMTTKLHVLESLNNLHLNKSISYSHAKRATNYSKDSDLIITSCMSLVVLAKTEILLGKYDQAEENLKTAKKLSIEKGQLICRMNAEAAEIERLIEIGNHQKATDLLVELKNSSIKLDSAPYRATVEFLNALILAHTGKTSQSLKSSYRSLELARSANYNFIIGRNLVNIGKIYLEQDKISDTWNAIDECKTIDLMIDRQYETHGLAILKAWYLIYSGSFRKAREAINKLEIFKKRYSISDRFNAKLISVELHLRKGEYKIALGELKEIKKEFPELADLPIHKCNLLLLEGDIGLASLAKSISSSGDKLPRKTFFTKLGITGTNSRGIAEEAIDQAYVLALSSGLEFQSALATLSRARFHTILSYIDHNEAETHREKALNLLEITSMLADNMNNSRLLFQIGKLKKDIDSEIPPKVSI